MKFSLLNFSTRSFLRQKNTLRTNLPYTQAITIGVLFSAEDRRKHEIIRDFIKNLEAEGKKVSVLAFIPDKKENYNFLFNYVQEKDFSFWGQLKSSDALDFAKTSFDFLFYLDDEPNAFTKHILARSKAKCRVGRHWQDGHHYFELMIASSAGTTKLIENMHAYASKIR